jgi:hypothetical protein
MGEGAKHKITIESDNIKELVQKLIIAVKKIEDIKEDIKLVLDKEVEPTTEGTRKTKISLLRPHNISSEDEDIEDVFIFEEADLKILYRALEQYKPTESEEQLYEILLESLDETLTAHTY